jgi:hypothetical protein
LRVESEGLRVYGLGFSGFRVLRLKAEDLGISLRV